MAIKTRVLALEVFGIIISSKKAGYRLIRMLLQNVLEPTVDMIFLNPFLKPIFFSLFFQVVLVEKFIANLPTLSNWGEQVVGRASLDLPQKKSCL